MYTASSRFDSFPLLSPSPFQLCTSLSLNSYPPSLPSPCSPPLSPLPSSLLVGRRKQEVISVFPFLLPPLPPCDALHASLLPDAFPTCLPDASHLPPSLFRSQLLCLLLSFAAACSP